MWLRANTLSVLCCGWNLAPLSCLDLLPYCLLLEARQFLQPLNGATVQSESHKTTV